MQKLKNVGIELWCNPHLLFAALGVCLPLLFLAAPVMAADDFGDMAGNVENQAKGIAGAAQMVFYLLGFVLVGIGLLMLAISREKKLAIGMLVVGFLLTSVGVFISIGSGSFFGSDQSQTDQLLN